MIALGGPTLKPDLTPKSPTRGSRLNDSTGRAYTETAGCRQSRKFHQVVSMIALGGPTLKPCSSASSPCARSCLNDSTGRAYTETMRDRARDIATFQSQ